MQTWYEEAFDANYGIRSQREVMEYVSLVNNYNSAARLQSSNKHLFEKWHEDIQEARDAVEEQQRGPRDGFEEVFHHLDRITTPVLKEGLRRYERYLDELPKSFVDPQFVKHRKRVIDIENTDAYGRSGFNYKPVEPPLIQQRRFLESAIYEIKAALDSRQESQPKAPRADQIAEEISRKIEAEAKLRTQCEEDVRKYPDQEEMIRRTYRRAIDALREME
jgi:hypothetical protein